MQTSALFGAKKTFYLDFSKFCPYEQGGLSQFGHFADKGDQFFAVLCGRPLWTAPDHVHNSLNEKVRSALCFDSLPIYSASFLTELCHITCDLSSLWVAA